jgi:hypothetical protein
LLVLAVSLFSVFLFLLRAVSRFSLAGLLLIFFSGWETELVSGSALQIYYYM